MEYFDPSLPVIEFDEPIDAPGTPFHGCTGLVRGRTFVEYSHQRIKQLMRDVYRVDMIWNHPGYKGGRYPGYKHSYCLKFIDTGEVINPRVWLDDLRGFLARQGHPRFAPKVKRQEGCERFLALLEQLREDVEL